MYDMQRHIPSKQARLNSKKTTTIHHTPNHTKKTYNILQTISKNLHYRTRGGLGYREPVSN
ncbi:hypothetical protein EON63_21865 [archaeon]|nr:MAG: hypothetical protein EON63_21865 [archaeon]